ncbi:hypothetical protein [Marinobacterium stanieri]|uniref:hypothetical protein n=1 Tax=Marinobacterium stanieri TaxID=49186 RepID=UPI00158E5B99|nr:hypothetical protein [Marinobacterium stanieri]
MFITFALLTPSKPTYAGCASAYACIACTAAALAAAQASASAAFSKMHAAIDYMGEVTVSGLFTTETQLYYYGNVTAASIRAASSNIEAEIANSAEIEKRLLDELNYQEETRTQLSNVMEQKRYLENTYSGTLPTTVLDTYGTQVEFTTDDYMKFLGTYENEVFGLYEFPRQGLFDRYVNEDELYAAEDKLWSGEIETAEEAAQLVYLTQQMLFSGHDSPYYHVTEFASSERLAEGLTRDQLKSGESVVWASRIKPALELFAIDQAMRMKPTEDQESVMTWLENRVEHPIYDPDQLVSSIANAGPRDVQLAIATEQKKRNLIYFLELRVNQASTRMKSARYGFETDNNQKSLRAKTNFIQSGE